MLGGYITFAHARSGQAVALEQAIGSIADSVSSQRSGGAFSGAGPILVGIGASLAAAAAPVWAMRTRGVHSWRLGSGDHPLPFPQSSHPVIGISQSGKSTETLAVLASVPDRLRYAVVNTAPSPVSEMAGEHLSLGNIPDSYASTIGYTATIAGLGMIADVWQSGELDPGWRALPARFRELEDSLAADASHLASPFDGVSTVDFVGAGSSVGSAEAGALLFREVARLHAAGMSTRQYLHGSMESAGDGVHVLLGDDRELQVAQTLSAAGHRVVLVSAEAVPDGPNLRTIRIPTLPPAQRAILEALVLQVLVERVAERHGVEIEEFVFHNADTKVGDAGVAP